MRQIELRVKRIAQVQLHAHFLVDQLLAEVQQIARSYPPAARARAYRLITLICSALILHEPMSRFSLLGAGLTLAGLVLSEWDSLRAMLRQRKAVPGEKSDDCNQPLSN